MYKENDSKRYIIFIIIGLLVFSFAFKSQVVIISYNDDYALRVEFNVFGFCTRVSASLKAAEPVVYNDFYFGGSIKNTISKVATQLENLAGEGGTFKLKVTGFPRNCDKLEDSIKLALEETGRNVQLYDNIA